jgi:hypothetical protein
MLLYHLSIAERLYRNRHGVTKVKKRLGLLSTLKRDLNHRTHPELACRLEAGCNACPVTDPRHGGVDRKRLAPYGMHPRGGINARLAAGGGVPLP